MPSSKQAIEFPSEKALQSYLKEHPDADRSKHRVQESKGKSPIKEETPAVTLSVGDRKFDTSNLHKAVPHILRLLDRMDSEMVGHTYTEIERARNQTLSTLERLKRTTWDGTSSSKTKATAVKEFQQALDEFVRMGEGKAPPKKKPAPKKPAPKKLAPDDAQLSKRKKSGQSEGDSGGKTASLRTSLIRLAHTHESLRPHILGILKEADQAKRAAHATFNIPLKVHMGILGGQPPTDASIWAINLELLNSNLIVKFTCGETPTKTNPSFTGFTTLSVHPQSSIESTLSLFEGMAQKVLRQKSNALLMGKTVAVQETLQVSTSISQAISVGGGDYQLRGSFDLGYGQEDFEAYVKKAGRGWSIIDMDLRRSMHGDATKQILTFYALILKTALREQGAQLIPA